MQTLLIKDEEKHAALGLPAHLLNSSQQKTQNVLLRPGSLPVLSGAPLSKRKQSISAAHISARLFRVSNRLDGLFLLQL